MFFNFLLFDFCVKSQNCDYACTNDQFRLVDMPNTENIIKCRVYSTELTFQKKIPFNTLNNFQCIKRYTTLIISFFNAKLHNPIIMMDSF